ncbi:hypothetical protein FG386_002031 [Cryptosporidium ryanae]|uniref:uncharacterized protein n=1 Tax=Cryptosporidium ryanae TaxID=515981 RepID=UPI003519F042|nr:hypothetical protein FG386_002031 [Cryptosporidium ryanae]
MTKNIEVTYLFLILFIFIFFLPFSEVKFNSTKLHEVIETGDGLEIHKEIDLEIRSTHVKESLLYLTVPYNYCNVLSKSMKSRYQWRDVSRTWQKRMRAYGFWICHRDCGGGGDCLYKSIISSMELNNMTVSMLRSQIADEFIGTNSETLRKIDQKQEMFQVTIDLKGDTISNSSDYIPSNKIFQRCNVTIQPEKEDISLAKTWNDTFFLEQMNILVSLELAGEWKDSWSPVEIMFNNFTKGVDISTNTKKALMVHYYLSKEGNTHWGSQWDVNLIEKIFNVKVLIFWKNRGIIYPTLGFQETYKNVVLIYYDDLVGHFQVVGIKKFNSKESDLRSIFNINNIPNSLKEIYFNDTHKNLY